MMAATSIFKCTGLKFFAKLSTKKALNGEPTGSGTYAIRAESLIPLWDMRFGRNREPSRSAYRIFALE